MMAEWQSGYAADCKSVYAGSIPTSASRYIDAIVIVQMSLKKIASLVMDSLKKLRNLDSLRIQNYL